MRPWYVRALLVTPDRIANHLAAMNLSHPPNEWQLCLGVLRLWHRLVFRSETIGTSPAGKVRSGWRARLLAFRPLRLPFLLAERAVSPLDFTGLASSPERLIRHLLCAHHDGQQFVFDLEILAGHSRLDELHRRLTRLLSRDSARLRWLRDLAVFDGYHEQLLVAVERALAGRAPTLDDPDISFHACMRWCAAQPTSPGESLRQWLS
jgi:hypothetical protein